jgi:hypothetical protein
VPSRQSCFSPVSPSCPRSRVQFPQIYPSADSVVILDAISLRLVRTLAFSQVFPGRDHASARITSLAVDPALKLVRISYPITMGFVPILHRRWSQRPVRGLPFGPSRGSLPALGLFTHRSFFLVISMSQLWIVDQVRFPCCCVSSLLLTRSRSLGRRDTINAVHIHFNHGE